MAILTDAQFSAFLKKVYDNHPETLWFQKCPLVSWVKKAYDFVGENHVYGILYEGIRTANDFAIAQSGKSTPKTERFTVTPVETFAVGSVNATLLRTSKKGGSLAPALKTHTDSALYSFAETIAAQCWGDGTGTRGTVGSYAAGVITLTEPRDSVRFQVGQRLESKTSSVLNSGTLLVTAINRKAGTLTVTKEDGHPDPAADDTLASHGDYTYGVASGVQAWVPATVASNDSFFGCNRSVDRVRLAGTRISAGGMSIEEAVFEGMSEMSISGGAADTLLVNPARYNTLLKSMQSKAFYTPGRILASGNGNMKRNPDGKRETIGFDGIQFMGENGPVVVVADRHCPVDLGLLTKQDAWELKCLDGLPYWSDEDGSTLSRETSAHAVEFRLASRWQLLCRRPVDAAIIDFETAA